ncbi:MAG: hypothetical protein ACLP9L_00610 [Thermoguttaceae bacterium]
MKVLELLHTREFNAEIDQLRSECFSGQYTAGTSRDSFDERSEHVLIRIDGTLAAAGRLTPGPDHFHSAGVKGAVPIPNGPDSVSLNRVHVAPAFRGRDHDLFELILLDGLLLAAQLGFRWVDGSYRPRHFKLFAQELGFREVGPPVEICFQSGFTESYQQIVMEVSPARCAAWTDRRVSVIGRLQERGFQIEDHGCNASASP